MDPNQQNIQDGNYQDTANSAVPSDVVNPNNPVAQQGPAQPTNAYPAQIAPIDTSGPTPAPIPENVQQVNPGTAFTPTAQVDPNQYGANQVPVQAPIQPGQPAYPAQQVPQPPVQPSPANATNQAQAPIKPKTNPNSTQNTLEIAEIRDGIVIMQDGSFRSVIMTKTINFDLMSGKERDGVEFSYQNFINSLYFDIQIFIRSQKIDLKPYIEKLVAKQQSQENMLLSVMMLDYIGYIENLAAETNIMDKSFYVVVPYYTEGSAQMVVDKSKGFFSKIFGSSNNQVVVNEQDLEKAKKELTNRTQAVINGLNQIGLQAVPLDTQELIELYYDFYNPDTATRQPLSNTSGLETDFVSKGEGEAPRMGAA